MRQLRRPRRDRFRGPLPKPPASDPNNDSVPRHAGKRPGADATPAPAKTPRGNRVGVHADYVKRPTTPESPRSQQPTKTPLDKITHINAPARARRELPVHSNRVEHDPAFVGPSSVIARVPDPTSSARPRPPTMPPTHLPRRSRREVVDHEPPELPRGGPTKQTPCSQGGRRMFDLCHTFASTAFGALSATVQAVTSRDPRSQDRSAVARRRRDHRVRAEDRRRRGSVDAL